MVAIKRSADLAAVALSSSKIATLYKRSVAPRYWEIMRTLRSLRRSNQRNFLAFYQLRVGYYERPPSNAKTYAAVRYAHNLARAREMRGISQEGLGQKVGRTQSFISVCEHAGTHLLVADFLRICHALDKSPYVILRRALTGAPATR